MHLQVPYFLLLCLFMLSKADNYILYLLIFFACAKIPKYAHDKIHSTPPYTWRDKTSANRRPTSSFVPSQSLPVVTSGHGRSTSAENAGRPVASGAVKWIKVSILKPRLNQATCCPEGNKQHVVGQHVACCRQHVAGQHVDWCKSGFTVLLCRLATGIWFYSKRLHIARTV